MTGRRVEIMMPDLSPTHREVTLVRWLAEVGEEVTIGQPLIEVETEKAVMDVEAVASGVLQAIHATPGDAVAVGQLVGVIATGGGAIEPEAEAAPPAAAAVPATASERVPVESPSVEAVAHDAPRPARRSLFERNRAARATASRGASPSAVGSALSLRDVHLTASARADVLHDRMGAVPVAAFVATAALRALAADPGALGGEGDREVAVRTGGNGTARVVGMVDAASPERAAATLADGAARDGQPAVLLLAVDDAVVESVRAVAAGVPTLAFGLPRLDVVATAPGRISVHRRLALSLSVDGERVDPGRAARWLGRVVAELEAL